MVAMFFGRYITVRSAVGDGIILVMQYLQRLHALRWFSLSGLLVQGTGNSTVQEKAGRYTYLPFHNQTIPDMSLLHEVFVATVPQADDVCSIKTRLQATTLQISTIKHQKHLHKHMALHSFVLPNATARSSSAVLFLTAKTSQVFRNENTASSPICKGGPDHFRNI